MVHYTEQRPWGHFEVLLSDRNCKVKRIVVNAKQRLSLQRHEKREEHWTIVSGSATVTLGHTLRTLTTRTVYAGETIKIPRRNIHRIEGGNGGVVFIEVQLGDYFGEDDIERFEDDFDRV